MECNMKDIQSMGDDRGIAIQKVGLTDVHLPFSIQSKDGQHQSVGTRGQVPCPGKDVL